MSGSFILLAFRAASNEVDDSFVHFWPPEVSSYALDGLVLAHVSGHLCVMLGFQDLLYRLVWYPEHPFSVQYPVIDCQFLSPVFLVRRLLFHLLVGLVLLHCFLDFVNEARVPFSCRE